MKRCIGKIACPRRLARNARVSNPLLCRRCVADAAASLDLAEYAADINMSVLGNMEFPPGWNLAKWTEDTEMLRAFMPTYVNQSLL
jgi:hypothetical protein